MQFENVVLHHFPRHTRALNKKEQMVDLYIVYFDVSHKNGGRGYDLVVYTYSGRIGGKYFQRRDMRRSLNI